MTVGELRETLQKYPEYYQVVIVTDSGTEEFVVVNGNKEEKRVEVG